MPINLATRIEFLEKGGHVTANLILKRNDSYMNPHNKLVLRHWAGNVDMQIILDQQAAISYMVKYATKGEKSVSSIIDLYKSVIEHTTEEENPITKLRSCMLKTVAGKRDLGQCEVSRLLMSEPLYHSSFEYVTQSLELNQTNEVNNITTENDESPATYKNLMNFFANRNQNDFLIPILHEISSFNQFVNKFKVTKGKLTLRMNPEKIIIVTYPKVHYNPALLEQYKEYCYYQLIKYSNWTINDLPIISDKQTAINRFDNFYQNASNEIKESIK
jgi:hypothetical protein